jgi:hypothetical protein
VLARSLPRRAAGSRRLLQRESSGNYRAAANKCQVYQGGRIRRAPCSGNANAAWASVLSPGCENDRTKHVATPFTGTIPLPG